MSDSSTSAALWIFTLTFLSLCSLYLLLCLLYLLYSLFKPNGNHKASLANFYIYISILCLIFSMGTAMSDLWHAIAAYIKNIAMYDLQLIHITITADIFYVLTMTVVYLFMIGRVYFTFNDSFFQISYKLTAFFLILIACNFIIWTIYIIILMTATDFTVAVHMIRHLEIGLLIVDFILNISLVLLFIFKLHELLVSSAVTRQASIPLMALNNMDEENKSDIVLDEDQHKFLNIISKHTLLCSCAICLNLIFYLTNLYSDFITTYNPSKEMYLLMYCGRTFGTLINAMVVFFNFKFTMIYYNFFCYCCHIGLNKCFFVWTKREIIRRVSDKYINT